MHLYFKPNLPLYSTGDDAIYSFVGRTEEDFYFDTREEASLL